MDRRLVVVAGLAALAPAARADDEPKEPRPFALTARLEGTTAVFVVRYAIDIDRGFVTNDLMPLSVPYDGIVTGVVVTTADGSRHRLAVENAEQATATFAAIGDRDGGADRAWAVHVSHQFGAKVSVEVAAPRRGRLFLDLEVSSPTCFFRDVRYASVVGSWSPLIEPALRTHDDPAMLALCAPNPEHEPTDLAFVAFPTRGLASRPAGDERIGTISGRLALDAAHVASVEIDLSREISEVPPDLFTAIVIDGSRSVDDDGRTAQAAIVESYLRAAPRGHVQIIAYDRKAHPLLPAWTTAAQATSVVKQTLDALVPRNGSNVDVGLGEAAAWLARVEGTRRIVLFTDELVGKRVAAIPPASLRTTLPPDTLVHVVALGNDTGRLARDDVAMFAPLAAATEGMAVRGGVDEHGHVDATKLARPIAIEQVKLDTPGWELAAGFGTACPRDSEDLTEGTSCWWWGAVSPRRVRSGSKGSCGAVTSFASSNRIRRKPVRSRGSRRRSGLASRTRSCTRSIARPSRSTRRGRSSGPGAVPRGTAISSTAVRPAA